MTFGLLLAPASPAVAAAASPPQALPENATAADLEFQPTLDHDTDG
jgi:hypothetical protein